MPTKAKTPTLKRETAGSYRSDDGRYLVRQQSGQWWVADTKQTDELGQQALRGPFASLSDATEAIGN